MSYERTEASLRVIGISTALLAFCVAASIGVAAWMYHSEYTGAAARPTPGRSTSFANGATQTTSISRDYAAVSRTAQERLHTYGWSDAKAGIAHVPIERAMDLLVHGAKPAPAPKPPGQVP